MLWCNDSTLRINRPTAGVSRVWAGVDSAWEQKKLKAWKKPINRADSHTSAARIVRPHGWQKKLPDEKKAFGAGLSTLLGNGRRRNACRTDDTLAGRIPQPKQPKPTETSWQSRLPMSETCQWARPPCRKQNRWAASTLQNHRAAKRTTAGKTRLRALPFTKTRRFNSLKKKHAV